MSTKKRARSSAATLKRALETGTVCETASNSISHDTTATAGRQFKIADLLSHGPENGITLRHLEKLTGTPGREIRREIERERRGGELIVSDNQHGYFLADGPAEALRFARSMKARAGEIVKTAKAIEKAVGGG